MARHGFHRRTVLGLLAAGGAAMTAEAQSAGAWAVPDDATIRQILVDRIDADHAGVGIVVGVISPSERRLVSYGAAIRGSARPLNGDTVFEIGSMTKVFTSLLLTEAVARGEVRLDEPVGDLLPATVHVPSRGGRKITLVDLATHTSGLPRLPTNLAPKDAQNPYADYTVDELYAFLDGYTLPRDIGAQYEYSNLGAGLLGHALARRAGVDYESLVKQRITGPLGMRDTAGTLTPRLRARLAQGYNQMLQPTGLWDIPALAGAGLLRSTANDLLIFLGAELGLTPTPLKPAMDAQLTVRRPGPAPNVEIALGWHVTKTPKTEIVWHNGGTGGFRTFMGFDRQSRTGVVVMTNAATPAGGDDIGFHLLTGAALAVVKPIVERRAIAMPAAQLEAYVGRYAYTPTVGLDVTRDGDQLYAQLTGQMRAEIYPESADNFFWRIVDAQVTFTRGPDGKVTGLVLHQNGRDIPAKRTTP